jgi:GNAT superfamily N-acetyltransferase
LEDDRPKDSTTVEYLFSCPSVEDFIGMRANCGWGQISHDQATAALGNSLFVVCAMADYKTIGFGRIIGDGALNFYIQDVIVEKDWRKIGIGAKILELLLSKLKQSNPATYTVGLMSAEGKEPFYEKFGFQRRPSRSFGAGMTMDV